MKLEIIIVSEVSQIKTEVIQYHSYSNKKMMKMNLFAKHNWLTENKIVAKGEMWGEEYNRNLGVTYKHYYV